jgi:predicted  nucleic acid-binding Zn-ribbon protein
MGIMEMPVSETERRKNHIDLIDPNHALLLIAKDCIRFQEKDRPSSEELYQRLAGLKETREYRESTCQIQDEVQSSNNQVFLLTQQLQDKDRRIHEMDDAISSDDRQVQDTHRALQQKEILLQQERASRERQLRQLNQQLEEHEQVTAETQQTNHSLQRQVEQLQQQLSQQSLKPPQPPPPSQAQVRGRQLQERESRKQLPVQPSLQIGGIVV